MSRCRGCDVIMDPESLLAINPHTGCLEDLCTLCRDPQNDNGIIYKLDDSGLFTNEVETFFNEAYFDLSTYMGEDLSDVSDIVNYIKENGAIKIDK